MSDDLRQALEAAADRGRPAGGAEVVRRAERAAHHARRRTRALTAAAVVTAVLGTTLGGGALYLRSRLHAIPSVDVSASLTGGGRDVPGEPMNVLVVGSDGRAEVAGERADVIMVARFDPAASRVALLSVPRDLWVPSRGVRINALLGSGPSGPSALIAAVRDMLGVRVDHYAEVDFDGFRRMVSTVGGVTLPFDAPARDAMSGLRVARAGCVRLDGESALAFVRSRHYEEQRGGRWVPDPTGDLGRIQRQHELLRRLAARVADVGANPLKLNALVDAAVDNVILDSTLSTRDLARAARQLREAGAAGIAAYVVPGTPTTVGGAAVLALDSAASPGVVAAFLSGATPNAQPAGAAPTPAPSSAPRC